MSDKKVKAQPDGYNTVIPYLIVKDAAKLIDFLKTVFNTEEKDRMSSPDGTVMHAELKIGDSVIMFSEASGDYKPNPTMLYIYVDDVDAVYKKALEAGATSVREPKDQFYGDRSCMVTEASGNQWGIATHVEDISPQEMEKRAKEAMKEQG